MSRESSSRRDLAVAIAGPAQEGFRLGGGTRERTDGARQDLRRHRRLDLRAVAWRVLSRGADAEARAGIRQPGADLHRDQRHLLLDLQAGELAEMARRDARGLDRKSTRLNSSH